MDYLFVVPARAGSKGVPGKNIKLLGGRPLICHTMEAVREVAPDEHICVSTDDPRVADVVKNYYGMELPFIRPGHLAGDLVGMREVLLHAFHHYAGRGRNYKAIVLLLPTAPFRLPEDIRRAIEIFESGPPVDMVVSVTEAKANPYFSLFEENGEGFLKQSKQGLFQRRQECPHVYQYNGAVYVIRAASLLKHEMNAFEKIVKYIMPDERSVDIDSPLEWQIAEYLMAMRDDKAQASEKSTL